ncbi:hypothetical protein ABPG72_008450 [Tetrahymena utriculariae]
MFQGISSSDFQNKGKKTCEMSQLMVKHNYNIGIKEWERPLGSVYKYQYINRKPDPNLFKPNHPSYSQVVIPHEHQVNQNKLQQHFTSETNKSFVKYVNPEKRKPLLGTQDLTQSKFVEASLKHGFNYNRSTKSMSHQLHDFKDPATVPDIKWKPQRQRFNPITNEIYESDKLIKASQFDFYNDLKSKNRLTHNYSHIPKPKERIDIITGRKLPPF